MRHFWRIRNSEVAHRLDHILVRLAQPHAPRLQIPRRLQLRQVPLDGAASPAQVLAHDRLWGCASVLPRVPEECAVGRLRACAHPRVEHERDRKHTPETTKRPITAGRFCFHLLGRIVAIPANCPLPSRCYGLSTAAASRPPQDLGSAASSALSPVTCTSRSRKAC